ncbi:MAG: acetyl-CoA carboxylase biotin carboxylase subunit, partial [Bacteroidota bacterium]
QGTQDFADRARAIGFPLLVKGAAGGGGKGMQIVRDPGGLEAAIATARAESLRYFGDGRLLAERFVERPRHIEVQVFADSHGNVIHLGERECSIQRRFQKLVEESPAPALAPALRQSICQAAVTLAKEAGYVNAGTVECIVAPDGAFYFLEMNTRLQVEHPVTEMITGVDLVKEQIRIAQGEPISFSQDDLKIHGHAVEIRVYAEDPANGFLPDIGKLIRYVRPQGPGIRVDDGYEEGMQIPIYYDPMISKLITWGETRQDAIDRMVRAIDEYLVIGCETTLPFCRFVMLHPAFTSGHFDTHFVKHYFTPEKLVAELSDTENAAASILAHHLQQQGNKGGEIHVHDSGQTVSHWKINRSR